MKKINCKRLLFAVLALAVVLFVVYRLCNRVPSEELTPDARVAAILTDG